jgi:hypothetical protein
MFDRFFSFPVGTAIVLEVYFNNYLYRVVYSEGKVEIPPQIDFLEKYKLFPFFIASIENRDAYAEFEYLFRFLSIRDGNKEIFSPLKALFEEVDAIEKLDTKEITAKSAASYSLVIEDLQDNKEKIVKQLDKVKKDRKQLQDLKNDLLQYAHFKEKYDLEYSSLTDDLKYLKDQKNSYLKKYQELLELLKEVDGNLSNLNAAEVKDEKELHYYLDHKKFLQEKSSILSNTIKELSDLQDTTKFRIDELEGMFKKYSSFKIEDLDKISKDLEKVSKKEEKFYTTLVEIDSNIKHARETQNTENILIEKSTYTDHVIKDAVSKSIPDFLLRPDLPQSSIVVKNYLRQLFLYLCTIECKKNNVENLTSSIVFTLLKNKFGFNPLILFTAEENIEGFLNTIEIDN